VSEQSFTSNLTHNIGNFRDKSFQAITCTGTDNSKQRPENIPKTHKKTQKQTGPR